MKFSQLESKTVVLPIENIDTDQIIPARFLKAISKDGMGDNLFCDWRYNPDGTPKPDFILNKPEAKGAQILVAGDNFGCGSSREHAPWAMADYGLRAVISTSFADIHRNNLLKNGIIPVVVEPAVHAEALAAGEKNLEFEVDLPRQTLRFASGKQVPFPIDKFSKRCLVQGVDELGYLMSHAPAVAEFEKRRA